MPAEPTGDQQKSAQPTADEPATAGFPDSVLDDLLPDDFDWRAKVRTYPLSALAIAGGIGFLLGRSRGVLLKSAVSRFAVDRVTHNLTDVLDRHGSG